MSEYKPSVSVVRSAYVHRGEERGYNNSEERGEAFDRFLAGVRNEAWANGFEKGFEEGIEDTFRTNGWDRREEA